MCNFLSPKKYLQILDIFFALFRYGKRRNKRTYNASAAFTGAIRCPPYIRILSVNSHALDGQKPLPLSRWFCSADFAAAFGILLLSSCVCLVYACINLVSVLSAAILEMRCVRELCSVAANTERMPTPASRLHTTSTQTRLSSFHNRAVE